MKTVRIVCYGSVVHGRHDDAQDDDVGGDLLDVEPIPDDVPVCSLLGIQGVFPGVLSSKFDTPPPARARHGLVVGVCGKWRKWGKP